MAQAVSSRPDGQPTGIVSTLTVKQTSVATSLRGTTAGPALEMREDDAKLLSGLADSQGVVDALPPTRDALGHTRFIDRLATLGALNCLCLCDRQVANF
jgi:hypothetical protein